MIELDHKFISELEGIEWFSCFGQLKKQQKYSLRSRQISCKDADENWSEEWEDLQHDINNDLFTQISELDPTTFDSEWDLVVDKAKEAIDKFNLDERFESFFTSRGLTDIYGDFAAGDILVACLESTWLKAGYSFDTFYLKLFEVYKDGHWPCGWEGEYPDGTLLFV